MRGPASRSISLLLSLVLVLSLMTPVSIGETEFKDIQGHWAYEDIQKLINLGLLEGYPDGTIRPDSHITKAEFIKLLNSSLGLRDDNVVQLLYEDVTEEDWFYKELQKASFTGYIQGDLEESFYPNQAISREETAKMLGRIIPEIETPRGAMEDFNDYKLISDEALQGVDLLVRKGYMSGYPDGTLRPDGKLTRAEAAKLIAKILDNETIVSEDVSIKNSGDILKDSIYVGDIYVEESVAYGDALLDNIVALSKVYIEGGGSNTIDINNSYIVRLIITKVDGLARVVVQGNSYVFNSFIFNGNRLVDQDNNPGSPWKNLFGGIIKVEGRVDKETALNIARSIEDLINSTGRLTPEMVEEGAQSVLANSQANSDTSLVIVVRVPVIYYPPVGPTLNAQEQRADSLVKEGYIPVANANELDKIRLTFSEERELFGKGTIWEDKYFTSGLRDRYVLVADIDMLDLSPIVPTEYRMETEINWNPLGDEEEPFRGVLDGNDRKISNLSIEQIYTKRTSYNGNAGLFGYILDGSVNRVDLVDFKVFGSYLVGGLSGKVENSTISKVRTLKTVIESSSEDITNDFDIIGRDYPGGRAGGLVGRSINSLIVDCENNLDVLAYSYVGGIVGGSIPLEIDARRIVESTPEVGVISSNNYGEIVGVGYVGGIAGGSANPIISATNFGNIKVINMSSEESSGYIGGIVGGNTSQISYSVNMGSVGEYYYITPLRVASLYNTEGVGGIVGGNDDSGSIYDVANFGDVIGYSYIGGVAGSNTGSIEYARNHDITIEGSYMVGGVAGFNDGYIMGSYNRGDIIATVEDGGGIVGFDLYGNISETFNLGDISSSIHAGNISIGSYIGGLVGRADGSTIRDSYSTGSVTGQDRIAGFVGDATLSQISNCYSTGVVLGDTNVSGFANDNSSSDRRISILDTTCYWDMDASGFLTSDFGQGLGTDEMIDQESFIDWNFEDIWSIDEGSYPYLDDDFILYPVVPENKIFEGGSGSVDDPYLVKNATQLNNVREYLDSHFKQIADIDLGVSPWNDEEGWNPIGFASTPFEGSYNGDEYSIDGLYINRPDYKLNDIEQGLFGYLNEAAILTNITLTNSYVYGYRYTGSLAGYSAGEISNCSSNNVEVLNEWDYAGGLIGYNSGTISNSSTTGTVKISDFNAGGLVGTNYGEIINCFSEANVSPIGTASGGYPYQMGGLVGYNSGGIIRNSYAKGFVNGWETIGGLVGENYNGLVDYCYSEGNVTGNEEYIGGLVGISGVDSIIRDSYSTATVSGIYYIGGLVGYNSSLIEGSHHKIGSVTGTQKVGGLVGDNNGTINQSYSTSTVEGNQYIGGISGYSGYGEIKLSYAYGSATGVFSVGGLVGSAQNTAINNSYASGSVTGSDEVGGLVGYLSVGSSVNNCYSVGLVTGTSNVGGLIGSKTTSPILPTVANSYYNSQTSNQTDDIGKGVPKTTEEMISLSTFEDWNFEDIDGIWDIDISSYPYLKWQDESTITYPVLK